VKPRQKPRLASRLIAAFAPLSVDVCRQVTVRSRFTNSVWASDSKGPHLWSKEGRGRGLSGHPDQPDSGLQDTACHDARLLRTACGVHRGAFAWKSSRWPPRAANCPDSPLACRYGVPRCGRRTANPKFARRCRRTSASPWLGTTVRIQQTYPAWPPTGSPREVILWEVILWEATTAH
jgi:hypothetical protein